MQTCAPDMTERANILLVDDKPERLLTYEVILEDLEQNLVRASSGEEAFEKLMEREFAAILLDVSMPGMDGCETAALIRSQPRFGNTPIVFVTGVHITDLDRLRGYEMGAADYVYVPVVPEILRGKVQVLVQLYLHRQELARLNDKLAAANSQLVCEVAERKRAEALLKEAARRKDEFISILGHELRNPLAAMQSGIELLQISPLPIAKVPWARELLQRQLRHLKRLIDDLLDVSRITTGRVQLQRESLDLKRVIEHSVDAARPLIDERQHSLEVRMPEEALWVNGDAVRLTQVFGNLLTNAAKYTEPLGTIVLTAETGEDGVTVRVKDSGAGIPANMLESIFELFTQAENEDTRTQSGLGIGLALVRALAELHGGRVHAASGGPKAGSEFVVTLPLLNGAGSALREMRETPLLHDHPTLRLLIIDDNVDLAKGLSTYFTAKAGLDVQVAYTGESGIHLAESFRPDVVLLDIGLPDIDGCEVARRLRARAEFSHVPLIAISGFSTETDKKRAKSAGFDRYFVKPVAFDMLHEVLAGHAVAKSAAG
jgi:signal transduction histidine kinase